MTRNTTSYREKGRAVVLAALMVLSVVAMGAAATGAVVAQSDDAAQAQATEISVDNVGGESYFAGQEINVTGFANDDRVQLREVTGSDSSSLDTYLDVDENNSVLLDTSGLDGNYFIRYDGGDTEPFEVTEQEVDFSFDTEEVRSGANTTLTWNDDNRLEEVDLLIDAEGNLSASELETVFADNDASEYDDSGDTVEVTGVSEGESLVANFDDVSTGDYNFSVTVEDTDATDVSQITVTEAVEEDVYFDAGSYQGTAGDTVEFTVEMDGYDTAFVNLNEDEGYYNASLEIDSEGAENVTIAFDTYEAGDDASTTFEVVSDDGSIEDSEESAEYDWGNDQRLYPGSELTLETGPQGEEATDAAILGLNSGMLDKDITTYVGHQGLSAGDDIEDVLNASVEDNSVAMQDLLVAEIDATGVFYAFDENGEWTDPAGVNVTFTNTHDPRYQDPESETLGNLTSNDDATVVADEDAGTVYVLLDPSDVDKFDGDETWNAEFALTEDNPYVASEDDTKNASTQFDVDNRNFDFSTAVNADGLTEVAYDGETATVEVESNVAPGTAVDFTLRHETNIMTAEGEIGEDGTASADFDLPDAETGDELMTVKATEVGGETASNDGGILAGEPSEPASFSIDASAPSSVDVDGSASVEVTVTNDGEVSGEDTLSVTVDGEEFTEELELDAGASSETFTYEIDTSSEGDATWSASTSNDDASGTVTVGDTGGSDGGDGDDGDDGDSDDSPGFGVAVALVALLSAAMLALRRQN